MPPEKKRIDHWMDLDLYRRVQAFAEKDRRSVMNAINYLVDKGLQEEKKRGN